MHTLETLERDARGDTDATGEEVQLLVAELRRRRRALRVGRDS